MNPNSNTSSDGQISTSATGGTAPYTFMWSTSDGSGLIQGQANQTMLGVGTYTLVVQDANGCTSEALVFVLTSGMPPEIIVEGIFITDEGCDGDCNGAVQATITGSGPFNYTVTNTVTGEVVESNVLPIDNLCRGSYNLSVTDSFGQMASNDFEVQGTDEPQVDLVDMTCDDGSGNGALEIETIGGPAGIGFEWSNGDVTRAPEDLDAGNYIVTVTFGDCELTRTYEVEDCDDTLGPVACGESSAVITPNGDGANDDLQVTCASDFPNTFAVYDRFGRVVYETTNYTGDWDGTDRNGEIVTEGVYYWVMDSTFDSGERRIFKGYVNVIRDTK